MSVIGVLTNTLLVYAFTTITKYRLSSTFFLGIVAAMDMMLNIAYLLVMVSHVLIVYVGNVPLFNVYHFYVRPVFVLGHVAKIASTFCLIGASQERWCICARERSKKRLLDTAWLPIGHSLAIHRVNDSKSSSCSLPSPAFCVCPNTPILRCEDVALKVSFHLFFSD